MVQTTEKTSSKFLAGVSAEAPVLSSASEVTHLLGSMDIKCSTHPVFVHRQVKAGQHLVRAGDDFGDLYVVNGGFFKTVFTDEVGTEQVLNFPLKGDLVGADGIGRGEHVNDVVALTDADVVVIPFSDLAALSHHAAGVDQALFRTISKQLIDEQLVVTAIGSLSAQTRVARFLLQLGDQMAAQGFSRDAFMLRMGRQDLANYLGMKIETVSRILTALTRQGAVRVNKRDVCITDRTALEAIAGVNAVAVAARPSAVPAAAPARKAVARPAARKAAPSRSARRTAASPWSGLLDTIGAGEAMAA